MGDAKISFTPITSPVSSRYIVVDMTNNGLYEAVFNDDTLPDGHPHKNVAVAAAAAQSGLFSMAFVTVLQVSSTNDTLMKVCCAVISDGVVHNPPSGTRPIHMLTRGKKGVEKVKYTTIPFNPDFFTPIFEKLMESPNE